MNNIGTTARPKFPLSKKLLCGILCLSLAQTALAGRAPVTTPGSLDTSFDADGIVTTDISQTHDYAFDMATQSDDKVVVAGSISVGGSVGHSFALTRYNTNGSLDGGFGIAGKQVTDFGTHDDMAYAVAVSAGKIIAAGTAFGDFALARYNADGNLDSSFGNGGKVLTTISANTDEIMDIAVQSDGKIVAVGNRLNSVTSTGQFEYIFDYSIVVARYLTDGSLDRSFGSQGIVITDLANRSEVAQAVAIQRDGKIVVSGVPSLLRYNTNGSLDTSFASGGYVDSTLFGEDVAIQINDKILIAGNGFVAQYDTLGFPDTTFGANGRTNITGMNGNAIAVQSNGKIVVGGSANPLVCVKSGCYYDIPRLAVARLNPSDGSLDSSFGKAGIAMVAIGPFSEANGVGISGSGKIVAAGYTTGGTYPYDFAVARFLP